MCVLFCEIGWYDRIDCARVTFPSMAFINHKMTMGKLDSLFDIDTEALDRVYVYI